ncbi:hypothetical protein BDA99DRAFT_561868 [Phascolomyces articulosus]|uniref:Uncharacterized protein n=1 Tax=Phascolomyces articulosus TaxID=60185 RepID=A0AAD5PDU1_9FUNG|nr:hypothetical protein BDA99DRAFT_561868 [Phascolomyces articulosus]
MSELRDHIVHSFRDDPLETLDVVASTLKELNVYITHDDEEEMGRQARLAIWQKVFVRHSEIWRWVLFLGDHSLLYLQGNGDDSEYATRFPSAITEGSTDTNNDKDDNSNDNISDDDNDDENNGGKRDGKKTYRLAMSFLSIIFLMLMTWTF